MKFLNSGLFSGSIINFRNNSLIHYLNPDILSSGLFQLINSASQLINSLIYIEISSFLALTSSLVANNISNRFSVVSYSPNEI